MQHQMQTPKTDDFRFEREGDVLILTFTPDGRSYSFEVQGGQLSDPTTSPPQANATDYADDEVRNIAIELARLALKGAP